VTTALRWSMWHTTRVRFTDQQCEGGQNEVRATVLPPLGLEASVLKSATPVQVPNQNTDDTDEDAESEARWVVIEVRVRSLLQLLPWTFYRILLGTT
jgi:hypothetical protein